MRKILAKRDWQLIMCFCILGPFIYFHVQKYWFVLAKPFIPATKSHLLAVVWLSGIGLVGALLAALLVAAPAAWAFRKRPLVLASVIALATGAVTLLTWRGGFINYAALFTAGELAAFFLLCWLTASFIVRHLHRHGHAI